MQIEESDIYTLMRDEIKRGKYFFDLSKDNRILTDRSEVELQYFEEFPYFAKECHK